MAIGLPGLGQGVPLKILFVVPYAPTRIRTRPFNFIRQLLAQGHQVTLATLWADDEERAAIDSFGAAGCEIIAERLTTIRSAWNCARALPGGHPLQAFFCWSPTLASRLVAYAARTKVDAIHVEHLRGAQYGLSLIDSSGRSARPPIVWDSVDCISGLFRRAADGSESPRARAVAKFELPRTQRYEGAVLRRFDRVVVTSETDRRELLDLAMPNDSKQTPQVEVVANGVDLDYFSPGCDERDPSTLVITGKMSYHANVTAVVRFVNDTMPKIWAEVPNARLIVVGKDPSRDVRRLEAPATAGNGSRRVEVTGTVPDIRPYLRKAAVAIAPIQYGMGVQNKVLEALACGTPVVATPQAVTALTVRPGDDLLVGSSTQELATAIVRLLQNPGLRGQIGTAGRQFATQRHGWSMLAGRLSDIYEDARH